MIGTRGVGGDVGFELSGAFAALAYRVSLPPGLLQAACSTTRSSCSMARKASLWSIIM